MECPICGIEGKISIENEEVKVTFSKEQQKRARNTLEGLTEHYFEIQGMKEVAIPKIMANKDKLEVMLEKYEKFESTY